MTCPLSLNHIELPCRKEKCGWWNVEECSIVTIAKNNQREITNQKNHKKAITKIAAEISSKTIVYNPKKGIKEAK